jgi:hypothetical protein
VGRESACGLGGWGAVILHIRSLADQVGIGRPSSEINRPTFHRLTHPNVLRSVTRSHISCEI